MSEGLAFKSFVSETELNEKRKKRQEEWEKVRTADQPEECPEEEYDNRSLFDRLQEQKDKKQAEYDEQHQFKNMVRGLDDDESKFLDEVAERQMELDKQKRKEEQEFLNEVDEYKNRVVTVDDSTSAPKTTPAGQRKLADRDITKKKSQASLLAGAVKRKKSEASDETDAKKPKSNTEDLTQSSNSSQETSNPNTKNGTDQQGSEVTNTGGQAEVVAVLPGLGHYTNSDDSDTSESSDSDVDLMGPLVRNVIKKKKIHSH